MSILVVDGMGGGLGAQIVCQLKKQFPQKKVIAVGTNAVATTNMIKAGADKGATGENALRVCLKTIRCVIGPIGIVLADSMMGEITPNMANKICGTQIPKVLIPVNHENVEIAGFDRDLLMADLIKDGVKRVKVLLG